VGHDFEETVNKGYVGAGHGDGALDVDDLVGGQKGLG
jgi:hypothetical protein